MKNQIILSIVVISLLTYCNTKPQKKEILPETSIDSWEAQPFLNMTNQLGEGAIWNHITQEFWHIDIEGQSFFITDISTKKTVTYPLDEKIGTIVPSSTGPILALASGIYAYDLASGNQSKIVNPEDSIDNIRFNDGKCDAKGRLWVGSMGLDQKQYRASLYKINNDGSAQQMLDSITISNGIVWTSDQKTMYYIDTPDENVKAFDFNLETGSISNERVVIEIGGIGFPDGMAIDAEGMLWIALWNGNIVSRWNPNTGKMIGQVNVPAHNITSCAFGGSNLDSLFITSARVDMTKDELETYPLSGSVFVVVPGMKGVKSNSFVTSKK